MKNLATTFILSSLLAAEALAQSGSSGGGSAGANGGSVVTVPSGTTARANLQLRQGTVRRVNPAQPTQSVNTLVPGTVPMPPAPQSGSTPAPNSAAPTVNSVPPAITTGPGASGAFVPMGSPQNSANTQVPVAPNQSVQSAFQQPLGTPLFNTTTPNTTPINTVPAVSNAPAGPNAVDNGFNFVPNAFTNVPIATNPMTPASGFPTNLPVRPGMQR
ncbi:MAG TPA: hypothetical protein VF988_01625 [Verrucomicrobiae bacterium]